MSAIIEFLNQSWVHAVTWALAGAVAIKFMTLPEMAGGGRHWKLIASGIFLYGLRVIFKVMPFYVKGQNHWSEVMRYEVGIFASIFLIWGFMEYYYTNLRGIIAMTEEGKNG